METQKENKDVLVHNENGEWISVTKVIFLFESFATKLKAHAEKQGVKFSVHKWYDGTFWCYRQEFEAINLRDFKMTAREWKTLVDQYVNI
ncbi:MAG: hypothetical protein IK117_10105 [Bacteroidales bacterium]|nr:hypothetical protein [Bacteroidales bacterium]